MMQTVHKIKPHFSMWLNKSTITESPLSGIRNWIKVN